MKFLALAFLLSSSITVHASSRLDNEVVIEVLGRAIFEVTYLDDKKGKLIINGNETSKDCELTKSLDDNHYGHVFKIVSNDKIIAYTTIWSRKSRVIGSLVQRNKSIALEAHVENPNSPVYSEHVAFYRRGKSVEMSLTHTFRNGEERTVGCKIK